MFTQTIKNIANGSTKIADFADVMDGSFKFRLKQMKECRCTNEYMFADEVDNCFSAAMEEIYNFSRLRHADKIGVSYWLLTNDVNQTLVPIDFFTMLDGKCHTLRQQSELLNGRLEFPVTSWGTDLECLVNFVDNCATKKKIVGQYRTLQNKVTRGLQSDQTQFSMPENEGMVAGASIEYSQSDIQEEMIDFSVDDAQSVQKPKKSRSKKAAAPKAIETSAEPNNKRRRRLECKDSIVEVTAKTAADGKPTRCSRRSKKNNPEVGEERERLNNLLSI